MSLKRGVFLSFTDQALLSATNFLVGLFVLRHVPKSAYGEYIFAGAVLLFLAGVQNAVAITPLTVLAPDKGKSEAEFRSALATGQLLLLLPFSFILLLIGWGGGHFDLFSKGMATILLVAGIVAPGFLLRELVRGMLFQRLRVGTALLGDLMATLLLAGGLQVVGKILPDQLHLGALFVTGGAALVAGVLFAVPAGTLICSRWGEITAALSEAWQHGRWALSGVVITWLQDQSYIYLLTFLLGAAGTADASAARLFLAPASLVIASFGRVLLPTLARLHHERQSLRFRRVAGKGLLVVATTVGCYVLVIAATADHLAAAFLPASYGGLRWMVLLWGACTLVQVFRGHFSWLLQASRCFRPITMANALSSVVTLLSGALLISRYGPAGGVAALIVGELVLTGLLWRVERRSGDGDAID